MRPSIQVLLLMALALLAACSATDRPSISLYLAVQRGDINQVERHIHWQSDINSPFPDGSYPLHVAAADGHIILVRMLLKNGAKANVKDSAGHTPLDLAILSGRTQVAGELTRRGAVFDASHLLLEAARRDVTDRDIVRYLLGNGADMEATAENGDTPLLIAIRDGNHRLASHLIAQGANVNARDAGGSTALALADRLGRKDIASLLRRQGARTQ